MTLLTLLTLLLSHLVRFQYVHRECDQWPLRQQTLRDAHLGEPCGSVDRRPTELVCRINRGTLLQKEVNDVVVAHPRGDMERSLPFVPGWGVHLGTTVYE